MARAAGVSATLVSKGTPHHHDLHVLSYCIAYKARFMLHYLIMCCGLCFAT